MKKLLPAQFSGIRKFFGVVITAVFMLIISFKASAQLVNQDFTGTTIGNNITTATPGWSLSASGNANYFLFANTTPLVYPGYAGAGGNYVNITTSTSGTSNVGQSFTSSTSNKYFYYSFLLNVSVAPTTGNQPYIAMLGNSLTTNLFARLYIQPAAGGYNLGIVKCTGTVAASNFGSTVLAVNTTYLVVVRYSIVGAIASDDLAYLWINPNTTAGEPLTTSAEASDISSTDATSAPTATQSIQLRSNTITPTYSVDAIKVGASTASTAAAFTSLAPFCPINATGYPKFSGTPSTSATILSNINTTGTTYYVVSPSTVAAPTSTQIYAGQDGTGAAAFKAGSFAVATANTDASTTVTGLSAGTSYKVYVVSKDASGNAQAFVNTLSIGPAATTGTVMTKATTTATLPGIIDDNGATTSTSFTYSIDAALATGTSTPTGTPSSVTAGSGATSVSASISGLTANTTYYYRITGTSAAGTTNGAIANFTTALVAPALSAATSVASNSFTINWGAVTGATSYLLDLSTASDFSTLVTGYNNLSVATTSQAVGGLLQQTTYYYRVRTVNANGTSDNSTTGSQLTTAGTPTISTGGTIGALNATVGFASPTTSFTFSALNVTEAVVLTAPTYFELSTVQNSGFANSISVGAAGNISTTTIYLRLAANAPMGSYVANNVVLTSAGATTVNKPTALSTVALVTYGFGSVTTSSGLTDPTAISAPAGLTPGSFSYAGGSTSNPNAAGRFSFTAWPTGATAGSDTFTGAINTGQYYQVTLTPASGYSLALSAINFTVQRSATGIRQFAVRSDAGGDNFATNLTASTTNGTVISVATGNILQITDATTTATTGSVITPPASATTSPVTFRFYGFNANSTAGTFSIDDVNFIGTVTQTPTVTSFASTAGSQSGNNIIGQPAAGGSTITITGTGFVAPMTISTGETVTVVSATSATYTLAAGTAGSTVTPTVTTAGGTSAAGPTITYAAAAAITAMGTVTDVSTTYGTATATPTTFTVGGSNLTANLVITPPSGFEVSTTAGSGYAGTVSLTPTGGTVSSITVYLRLAAATAVGTYSGNVTISSTGATSATLATASSTVSAAALTVTATGPLKAYGTALATGTSTTNFSVTGTLAGTETLTSVTLTPDAAGMSATTAAASAYVVTPSAATGGNGFTASNYNITYTVYNGTVAKTPLTITANNTSKVYGNSLFGGSNQTAFTSSGLVNSEAITGVALNYTAGGTSNSAVGTYNAAITPSFASGMGFNANNYNITYAKGNLTVTAAPLTITASTFNKPYGVALTDGAVTTGFTTSGLKNADAISGVNVAYGTGSAAGAALGTYTGQITPSAATGSPFAASNYTITYVTGDIVVSTAALIVTATGPSKTYGTALTTGTSTTNFTVSGSLNSGEALTSVTLTPDAAGSSATTSAGSAYTVTPSAATGTGGFTASNYNITYTPYNGTVGTIALTVAATGPSKTYGTALATGTSTTNFTVTGTLASGENLTGVTLTPNSAGTTANTAAGSGYVVTPSSATGAGGFTASNYNITYTPYNGTVTTAPLTVTATGPSKTYGTALTAGTSATDFTVTGTLAGSETLTSVTLTPNAAGTSAGTAAGLGYTVTPSAATGTGGFAANNYNITYTAFSGTVAKAALTITADNQTKTYGTANPTLTASYSGFVNMDNAASLSTAPTITTTAGTNSAVNTYPITASGAAGANYNISYAGGTLTITQATATLTLSNLTQSYDGTAKPVTVTTNPAGLSTVSVTYNGSGTAPSAIGSYSVIASLSNTNYTAANATGTLTITPSVYYTKSTGDLSTLSTYGSLADGTGTVPTDFNGSGTGGTYQLANRATYTLASGLTVGSTLNIPSGASLDLAGNTLMVSTLAGAGTVAGSNTSSLVVTGTTNLAFAPGKQQLKNLTLNTGASATLTSVLNIAGTGTLILGTNAVLNTGGLLTLKSDASGTASVAALATGASISGSVTAERYVFDKRAWRLIAPAVSSTQTINTAWQEGAGGTMNDPNPGYGTFMIGSSLANGFDIASSSGSLLAYSGGAFGNVANTGATVSSQPGYFLFSIGSRSVNPATAGVHSATVLRTKGTVATGTQAKTINGAGYTLVGNPYPAAVDFGQVARTSNIPNQFYTWDIGLGTYGGYVLVTYSGGAYTSVPASPSGLSNIIPSGAAIFLQSDGATTGTLTFSESSKATAAGSNTFSTFGTTAANTGVHNLRVNLTDANANLIDGVMASFAAGYSNNVDANDAAKLTNIYENMSLNRSGTQLTMERREDITARDTVYIRLSAMKAATYQLQIDPSTFNKPGMTATLQDAYLKTSSKVDLGQVSNISFTATGDAASYKDRFSITFTPAGALLSFVNVNGAGANKQINVNWNVTGEDYVQQYTVEKWNGTAYTAIAAIPATQAGSYSSKDKAVLSGDNVYRINAKDLYGNVLYSKSVTVAAPGADARIVAYPNPVSQKQVNLTFSGLPAGSYNITVSNVFGQVVQHNSMLYNGTTANKLLNVDYVTGVYTVNIQSGGYNETIKIIIL